MLRRLIPALIIVLILTLPTAAFAGEREVSVLKAFFDVLAKKGPDVSAGFQMIGRLGDEIRNLSGTLHYKAPSLVRAEFIAEAGKTALVVDLATGKGFFQVADGALVVRFASAKELPRLPEGGLRQLLFELLTADPVDLAHENGQALLIHRAPDGKPLFRLEFAAGLKTIERFVQYDEETGDTRLALRLKNLTGGKINAADFTPNPKAQTIDLPADADTPFDYLFSEE